MSRLVEVPIYADCVWPGHIVSVLIYASVCALSLDFAYILFLVTFYTKAKVYSIFRLTICLVPSFETFACSAGKEIRVDDVVAAHAI